MTNGAKVWFRGCFAKQFSVRGTATEAGRYGIRLENGNFVWAGADQLRSRD